MRTSILKSLLAVLVFGFSLTAFCVAQAGPSLKESNLVTEVLPWGETVTAVRLEYTEEIFCGEVTLNTAASDSSLSKYHLFADRVVVNAYVNNSGKKGDVQVYGKYVFLELGTNNMDPTTYRSQVTFNPTTKTRNKLVAYNLAQVAPITTRSGKVVGPTSSTTTGEICVGMDDYKAFPYKNEVTGHTLTYLLYIPKGYETKAANLRSLPLVVHFPAGDFNYADWTGKYRGALFSHHDALYWSDDDAQAKNPAFVVTVGGPADPTWASGDFSQSEMQQNYVKVIQKIMADYNVDAARIYGVSLAGGSPPMWNTILANPTIFAAQISTSYDPYHAYRNAKIGEEKFTALLKTMPGWFFAGLHDATGLKILGPDDLRLKGERLRDIAEVVNKNGMNVDIAYGKEGELMWNGLLRGDKATKLAEDQLARAKAHGARHLVTVYMPGTILISQHWVWDATYANAGVRGWLFQQVNKAPYVPGK